MKHSFFFLLFAGHVRCKIIYKSKTKLQIISYRKAITTEIINICQSIVNVYIYMKHINREQILQRRKQKKIKTQIIPQKSAQISQLVDKQIRHISDQTIDHIIKCAIKNTTLTNDDREDILHIIAAKSGIHFNRHILVQEIELIYCPHVVQLSINWEKSQKSYFILKGSLLIYQQIPHQKDKYNSSIRMSTKFYDDEQSKYLSHEQFQKQNSDYHLNEEVDHFRGVGILFKKQSQDIFLRQKLIAINEAVLVCFRQIKNNLDFIYHDGITNEGKTEILNQFTVLKVLGKRIKNFIKYFNVRHFSINQIIYKKGDIPDAVYFLIKGEVKFEYQMAINEAQSKKSRSARYQTPFIISTQVIGQSTYFGQEEILANTKRCQTAKALSEKCVVLEFMAQRFQKLMEHSEFNSIINAASQQKRQEREYKIEKTKQILQKQDEMNQKISGVIKADVLRIPTQPIYHSRPKKHYSHHNDQNQKINWMHGHIARKPIKSASSTPRKSNKNKQPFSMLHVNPDMYEATRKKYRKYNLKTVGNLPDRHWDYKNIWKVLKLEDVLREEQVIVSSPTGRRFYQHSKRRQHQLKQTHSIRPRTASTSYHTKLQYIAYLSQFNN